MTQAKLAVALKFWLKRININQLDEWELMMFSRDYNMVDKILNEPFLLPEQGVTLDVDNPGGVDDQGSPDSGVVDLASDIRAEVNDQ